jgi:hypothetical protein
MKFVQDIIKEKAEEAFKSFLKDKTIKKYLEKHCKYYDADPIHFDGNKLSTITLVLDTGRYGVPTDMDAEGMKTLFGL